MQIGMGIPLYRIPDIRRLFGCDSDGSSRIDFERDLPVAPLGMCWTLPKHSNTMLPDSVLPTPCIPSEALLAVAAFSW